MMRIVCPLYVDLHAVCYVCMLCVYAVCSPPTHYVLCVHAVYYVCMLLYILCINSVYTIQERDTDIQSVGQASVAVNRKPLKIANPLIF